MLNAAVEHSMWNWINFGQPRANFPRKLLKEWTDVANLRKNIFLKLLKDVNRNMLKVSTEVKKSNL